MELTVSKEKNIVGILVSEATVQSQCIHRIAISAASRAFHAHLTQESISLQLALLWQKQNTSPV